ncbi:hypothetical protein BV20DRAFT_963680 [Pilatotrama ljubarskyi]|nr:hypothetical protein BV20DRAFT_963680 [Pilatotrama ljubarskyi]
MSSHDEEGFERATAGPSKRRKVLERACDYCRRKKIKCDGPQMPNKRCTKCIKRRAECTYVEPFNKPRYADSYVEDLEKRLQKAEGLLNKLSDFPDVAKVLEEAGHSSSSRPGSENAPSPASAIASLRMPQLPIPTSSPDDATAGDDDDDDLSDHDEVMRKELAAGFSRLSLQPTNLRYHGKSSGWVFIQCIAGLGQDYVRDTAPQLESGMLPPFNIGRGAYKYKPQPWLERPFTTPSFDPDVFPPDDLLEELVCHYFRHINDYAPLLHEPTFRQNIRDGLHFRQGGFGATVLLVCATGARFSDDPRVLLEGTDTWQSAGWKWFQTVDDMHKTLLAPVHVYDLQIAALWITYMQTTTLPHTSWLMTGLGMRKALDIGAHRKSMYGPKPTVEDELWRRAFWILLTYEWTNSYGLGRPPCLHDEEFDVALPIECDDEYWVSEDPEKAFKQPPGKPSKITFWTSYVRLSKIVGYVLRTLYSLRKSRTMLGNDHEQWEERIVAELDSELNRWIDTVPDHLRWNPACEDDLFLGQSAALYVFYYQVQVMVHRPFITWKRGSPKALASLIICTNAARTCIQILEQLRPRLPTLLYRHTGVLFMAGLVLLISMWGQRRSGRHLGANRDREYIEKCIDMLHSVQRQNNVAERLRDMLQSFLSLDAYSLRSHAQPPQIAPRSGSGLGGALMPDSAPLDARKRRDGNAGQLSAAPSSSSAGTPSEASQTSSQSLYAPSSSSSPQESYAGSQHQCCVPGGPVAGPSHVQGSSYAPIADPLAAAQPMNWQQTQNVELPPPPQSTFDFYYPLLNAGPTASVAVDEPAMPSFGPGFGASHPQSSSSGVTLSGEATLQDNAAFPMDMSFLAGPSNGGGDGLLDCAFVDDTMTMWSHAPASFGWQDWEAYFNTVNGSQRPGN